MAELMKDPDYQAAWKLTQEARIDRRYGQLFKDLNLPADQLATLKTLLIERENARRDVWNSAAAQGLNPRENRDELDRLTNELRAEIDNTIKTRFGDTTYTAYETYNASSPQRNAVNDLTQRLANSNQALSDSQARQLTRLLAETPAANGDELTITADTLARAQNILTSPQLAMLRKLQSEIAAQQLLDSKARALRASRNPPP